MENKAAKMTAAYFDSMGLHYELAGENSELMATGFGLRNLEGIKVFIVFDEGEESVGIRCRGIAKFPEAKKDEMFKFVNGLNSDYRWIKFVIDEEENSINAEDDAVIQLDSCGKEVFECCGHFAAIIDTAYPDIMKAIYA